MARSFSRAHAATRLTPPMLPSTVRFSTWSPAIPYAHPNVRVYRHRALSPLHEATDTVPARGPGRRHDGHKVGELTQAPVSGRTKEHYLPCADGARDVPEAGTVATTTRPSRKSSVVTPSSASPSSSGVARTMLSAPDARCTRGSLSRFSVRREQDRFGESGILRRPCQSCQSTRADRTAERSLQYRRG